MTNCQEIRSLRWIFDDKNAFSNFRNLLKVAEINRIKNYDVAEDFPLKVRGLVGNEERVIEVKTLSFYPEDDSIVITSPDGLFQTDLGQAVGSLLEHS